MSVCINYQDFNMKWNRNIHVKLFVFYIYCYSYFFLIDQFLYEMVISNLETIQSQH